MRDTPQMRAPGPAQARRMLSPGELAAYRRTAVYRVLARRRLYRWWIVIGTGLVALMFLAREGII